MIFELVVLVYVCGFVGLWVCGSVDLRLVCLSVCGLGGPIVLLKPLMHTILTAPTFLLARHISIEHPTQVLRRAERCDIKYEIC